MTAMSINLQAPVGVGSPEGVVTAPVGSIYTDTAATNGAVRWIKESGTGATGWRVIYGDTGWRNVSGYLTNGWATPSIWIRRRGDMVEWHWLNLNAAAATDDIVTTELGQGWSRLSNPTTGNPVVQQWVAVPLATPTTMQHWAGLIRRGAAATGTSSVLRVNRATLPSGTSAVHGSISYVTADPWPTTLPGT